MTKRTWAISLAAASLTIPLATFGEPTPTTGPVVRVGDTPQLLKTPPGWRLEMLDVPIVFAPDIALKGWEEVRFAPGVFNAKSPNYFTYAFAIAAEGNHHWGTAEVKDFLERYYRGLSTFGGKKADVSEVRADVTPDTRPDHPDEYVADVTFFDQFTDGRKITVRIEVKLFNRPAIKQFFLIALISPTPAGSDRWQILHRIGTETAANVPD